MLSAPETRIRDIPGICFMVAPHRLAALMLLALVASPSAAAEIIPPVSERFKNEASEETTNFQRHVVPLMGRLGCNGRACHGSFQGQGGFRLSLFGYDFKADHDAVLGGMEPRVNAKTPTDSLILRKPTKSLDHRGGKRMEEGGWEYNLLLRWIKAGTLGVKNDDSAFVALEVEPKEIVFAKPGDKA